SIREAQESDQKIESARSHGPAPRRRDLAHGRNGRVVPSDLEAREEGPGEATARARSGSQIGSRSRSKGPNENQSGRERGPGEPGIPAGSCEAVGLRGTPGPPRTRYQVPLARKGGWRTALTASA